MAKRDRAKTTPRAAQQDPSKGGLLVSLFWEFFKIGLFTIGGGLAMIPLLERIATKDKRWLTEEEMMDCFAISQSLPGVVAVNMATYVGRRKAGLAGAVLATIGVVLPSFLIIVAVANILLRVGENPYLQGAFTGIKAGLCGMIFALVLRMGRKNLKDAFGWLIALAGFVLIAVAGVNAVWVILGAILLGIGYQCRRSAKPVPGGDEAPGEDR